MAWSNVALLSLPCFDCDHEPLGYFAAGLERRLADVQCADLGRYHFDRVVLVVDILVADSTLGLALEQELRGDDRAGLRSLHNVPPSGWQNRVVSSRIARRTIIAT